MIRRLTAAAVLVGALALGACVDPNSPVDPRYSPTYGVVVSKDFNQYGDVTFFYLYVRGGYGAYWVSVSSTDWWECNRLEIWSRGLGCR